MRFSNNAHKCSEKISWNAYDARANLARVFDRFESHEKNAVMQDVQ